MRPGQIRRLLPKRPPKRKAQPAIQTQRPATRNSAPPARHARTSQTIVPLAPHFSRFSQAWAKKNLVGALESVNAMFIPQDVVLFGGETYSKVSMADLVCA
jgi:hypothetical protein